MPFRPLSIAVAVLPFLAAGAFAAEVSPETELVLSCATIISLKAEDARNAGDSAGANEWGNRAGELEARARGMLDADGFTASEAEDVVMNSALMVGLNVGFGAPPYTDAECFALFE